MTTDPKSALNDTMASSMQGFTKAATAMQAVTNEMMAMSMDSMRQTSQAFTQMQSARSLTDIARIQQDFFRTSFEQFAQHSRRIAELSMAGPMDFANRAREAVTTAGEHTKAVAVEIGHRTQATVQTAADDVKAATVGLDGPKPPV